MGSRFAQTKMAATFTEVYQEITPLYCQDVEDLRRRDCAVLLVNTAQYKINCHNPRKALYSVDVPVARDLAQEETLTEISAMMEANGYLNYDSEYFVVKCTDNGVFITFEDEQLAKDIIAHSDNYKQSFLKRKIPLKYVQERKAREDHYNPGNHQAMYNSAYRVCQERLDQEQCD